MVGAMADIVEHRNGPDRRRQPRGGRRTTDLDGVAPLVLVIGEKPGAMHNAEAILAKLRFAVTTSPNTDEALKVLTDLRPDVVVANEADAPRIRSEAPVHLPVVTVMVGTEGDVESLLQEIRRALHRESV